MDQPNSKPKPKPANRTKSAQSEGNNVQMAYDWIKSEILSGRFKAGETLTQGALAKHCNTSRGPIREALRMLQNQGLVEAEANQRGRVASFTALVLEQTIASAIVIAGAAISRNTGQWTSAEVERFETLIDDFEALTSEEAITPDARDDLINRRQHIYRMIVADLCAKGGAPVQHILAGHFDRITIFRQMSSLRLGDEPEFPLAADLSDLRQAIHDGDSRAAALAIISRMAELGRYGLDNRGEYHLGGEISAAVEFVSKALGTQSQYSKSRQIRTGTNTKISVELKGEQTLIWNFSDE